MSENKGTAEHLRERLESKSLAEGERQALQQALDRQTNDYQGFYPGQRVLWRNKEVTVASWDEWLSHSSLGYSREHVVKLQWVPFYQGNGLNADNAIYFRRKT